MQDKEVCYEIVLALHLVLDYLRSKKSCTENSDTSVLYPFRAKHVLFSKCEVCGKIVVSYGTPRNTIRYFYNEIRKIMAST